MALAPNLSQTLQYACRHTPTFLLRHWKTRRQETWGIHAFTTSWWDRATNFFSRSEDTRASNPGKRESSIALGDVGSPSTSPSAYWRYSRFSSKPGPYEEASAQLGPWSWAVYHLIKRYPLMIEVRKGKSSPWSPSKFSPVADSTASLVPRRREVIVAKTFTSRIACQR